MPLSVGNVTEVTLYFFLLYRNLNPTLGYLN